MREEIPKSTKFNHAIRSPLPRSSHSIASLDHLSPSPRPHCTHSPHTIHLMVKTEILHQKKKSLYKLPERIQTWWAASSQKAQIKERKELRNKLPHKNSIYVKQKQNNTEPLPNKNTVTNSFPSASHTSVDQANHRRQPELFRLRLKIGTTYCMLSEYINTLSPKTYSTATRAVQVCGALKMPCLANPESSDPEV